MRDRRIGETGVTAEAAAHLRDAIRDGRLAPGARIVERPVAQELGISAIAVRDALARLTQEGWVERLPRRGARVRDPTPAELDDITAVRVLVEGEALARASVALDDATQRELRALLTGMEQAAGRDGTDRRSWPRTRRSTPRSGRPPGRRRWRSCSAI